MDCLDNRYEPPRSLVSAAIQMPMDDPQKWINRVLNAQRKTKQVKADG